MIVVPRPGRLDVDRAAAGGDDAIDGGEPESCSVTVGLGCVERFEYVSEMVWIDSAAGVGDLKHHGFAHLVVFDADVDRQQPAVDHRVSTVDREVEEHLFDLAAIRLHRDWRAVDANLEIDVLGDEGAKQVAHAKHGVCEVDDFDAPQFGLSEHEQLPGEGGRAINGTIDLRNAVDVFGRLGVS